ncbi:MAG: ferrochelatase [Pseudobdellovibrionaceae bacterium]
MQTGIVLINVGSPKSYEVKDVADYLKVFLMDEDIITAPYLIRWILVHLLIVPRRAVFSAANYKKVWTDQGSPLVVNTLRFTDQLQKHLPKDFVVKVGMRYGEPSIERAMQEFNDLGINKILLVPLFPQWAQATTGSGGKWARKLVQKKYPQMQLTETPPFYADDFFIDAFVRKILEQKSLLENQLAATPLNFSSTSQNNSDNELTSLRTDSAPHYLFSFHGLPENQVKKVQGCLASADCCQRPQACPLNCYRAQCVRTAETLAKKLNLNKDQYSISFQSRLGPTKWIQPYTDDVIKELLAQGKKNLIIACPAFVADCIETLEEIGIGLREDFHHQGGENFMLASCPNDDSLWAEGFAKWLVK